MTHVRLVTADRGDAGRRIDLVLQRHLADLRSASRTRLQAWIADGRVSVNGSAIRRSSARAAAGDAIAILLPDPLVRHTDFSAGVQPDAQPPIEILFEDDHLIAVNKPAGVVVHPAYKHPSGTLMDALVAHRLKSVGGNDEGGNDAAFSIAGRLDKLTSGIVLLSKRRSIHATLQRTLASRDADKSYLAIVYGPVRTAQGTIDAALARDPADRRRVIVAERIGRRSVTKYERIARLPAAGGHLALLRCRLRTGRTHQIRVHLASRGWPIVGDAVYGEPRWSNVEETTLAEALRGFQRQALHAWRLTFRHPLGGAQVSIEAPIPDDLRTLMHNCGWHAYDTF